MSKFGFRQFIILHSVQCHFFRNLKCVFWSIHFSFHDRFISRFILVLLFLHQFWIHSVAQFFQLGTFAASIRMAATSSAFSFSLIKIVKCIKVFIFEQFRCRFVSICFQFSKWEDHFGSTIWILSQVTRIYSVTVFSYLRDPFGCFHRLVWQLNSKLSIHFQCDFVYFLIIKIISQIRFIFKN